MFVSGLVDHDRVPQHRPGLGRGESLSLSASLVGSRSGSIVAPRRVSAAPRRPASASSRRVPRLFPAWEATGPWSRPDTDPKGSRQAATQRSRPSTCHSRKSVNRLPHPRFRRAVALPRRVLPGWHWPWTIPYGDQLVQNNPLALLRRPRKIDCVHS